MEARADLEERGDAAAGLERPRGGLRGARDELEQRRLARAVRADDAERVTLADLEAHVVERLDLLGRRVLAQRPLLQRAALLAVQRVDLRKVLGADGERHTRSLATSNQRD